MFGYFSGYLDRAFVAALALAAAQCTTASVLESDEIDPLPLLPDVIDLISLEQSLSVAPASVAMSSGEVHMLFRERGSPAVIRQYAKTARVDGGDVLYPYIAGLAQQLAGEAFELPKATPLDPPQQFYAALIKSLQARDRGQIDSAVRFVQQALEYEPRHPFALNLLAQLRVLQERYDEAEQLLTLALEQAPGFAGAITNRAALAYAREDYNEAVGLYDRALSRQPDLCAAILGRSAAQLSLGNLAESAQYLEKCADVPGFDFNVNLMRVGLAIARRDYSQAEEIADWFREAAPDSASYWLAETAMHRGNPESARKHLDAVEADSPRVKYLSALVDSALGEHSAALSTLRELGRRIKTNPALDFAIAVIQFADENAAAYEHSDKVAPNQNDPVYAFLYASQALARGNVAEAAEFWRKSSGAIAGFDVDGMSVSGLRHPLGADNAHNLALAVLFYDTGYNTVSRRLLDDVLDSSPEMPVALLLNSIVATGNNEQDVAASTVEQLLKLEPQLFSALYQSAELSMRTGNYERARMMLARAVAEKPDKGALLKLALLEESTSNMKNAVTAMKTYIDAYPSDFVGYNQLAWFYAKREQNLDQALQLALEADRLRTGNVSVLDTIGWIYFLQGDLDDATEYLQAANDLASGKHPDVLFHLAAVAAERGEKADAGRLIKQALQLPTPFDSRDAALQLLATLDTE